MFNRRFASSFASLRIEHRRVKNFKNEGKLSAFETADFNWPVKEPPCLPSTPEQVIEDGSDDENEEDMERSRPAVITLSGRASGNIMFVNNVILQIHY